MVNLNLNNCWCLGTQSFRCHFQFLPRGTFSLPHRGVHSEIACLLVLSRIVTFIGLINWAKTLPKKANCQTLNPGKREKQTLIPEIMAFRLPKFFLFQVHFRREPYATRVVEMIKNLHQDENVKILNFWISKFEICGYLTENRWDFLLTYGIKFRSQNFSDGVSMMRCAHKKLEAWTQLDPF